MNGNLSFAIAFSAGFLSFLSPCVLPLVPSYLAFLLGDYSDQKKKNKNYTIMPAIIFIAGFTIVFILLGLSATFLGKFLLRNQSIIRKISGVVIVIFGLHISDYLPVGTISYRPEGIMASSNTFKIEVKGKQAHGSTPWFGVDPIVTAAQIINNTQTIVSRSMPLTEQAAVVTFGVIEGGVRHNIIPESVSMQGTIRALDEDMRQTIFERLETIVQNTAESNGAEATLAINDGYLITYNDPELTAMMEPTLKEVAGEDNANIINAITGAEDFSFFQREIPGLYFFIGGKAPGREPAGHHTPDFYIDESGMKLGVRAMANLVIDYMDREGDIDGNSTGK